MPAADAPSHAVEEMDDRVVIRDLELFSGYDPSIDDGTDEEIKRFDRSKVRSIVGRTKQFIARRQHPRLVILHSQEDHSEPKEAVGAVLDVRLEDRDGVPFVVGDVEMSRDDFQKYVASNRFPRRSAEIWQDGHMSEVALLGRDTPRRPLPDTRFSKVGNKVVFAMECSTCFEAAPGVGNVFVPGAGTGNKERNMADAAADEKKDEKDEMMKMVAEMKGDIERLKDENRKLYNELCGKMKNQDVEVEVGHTDADSHKDEDEDEEEDEKKFLKKSENSRKSSFDKARFERRIAALESELAKERFSRELDLMEADGFAVACCRDEMIAELSEAKDPARKIAFWRENFRRDPVGVRVGSRPSSGLKAEPASSNLNRETVAKLVAEAAGDAEKFKNLMAKAKAGQI